MTADVYKLNTLNLFQDLKHTNIKNEEFKQILSSYQKLASSYIKDNQTDLFKDLNKQKEVIFSYLPSLRKESLKKVAHLQKQLEAEMGNIDEIDTLSSPEKQVQFIKVAYNNGKWTIYAHNLNDAEFTKKETPEAINCLVNLADRLDEQEAAYALCHAKKAGLFTMAALPYVRTQEFTNTALEPRYVKDPGTVLGPIDHSWESSVDNTNMPVSRQIAALEDDFQEMDTFKDQDGDYVTISSISGDAVITFDNDIFTKEEVEENIKSGYWTKVEAAKDDIKLKRLEKQADDIIGAFEEKLILDEAAQRLKDEFAQRVEDMISQRKEKRDEIEAQVEPRLRKIASKIDAITMQDKKAEQKFQKLRRKIGNLVINFSREVPEYQRKAISNVKDVEQLLEEARKYVSPKNLKAFEENVVNKFFYFNSKSEDFKVTLDTKDPRSEEMIQEEVSKMRKNLKMSQNTSFDKDAAYKELDEMLISGQIDFNTYNEISDFAEMNSKAVMASLKIIKSNLNKTVKADLIESVVEGIKSLFSTLKQWISTALTYLLGQEKDILDINDKLDQIIQEGE